MEKIDHIALTVRNLEESIAWYSKNFGFEEEKRFNKLSIGAKAVFMKADNVRIELFEFDDAKEENDNKELSFIGIRHIAFSVADINKKINELSHLKFSEIDDGASGHRYCFTEDPNGIQIELYENG